METACSALLAGSLETDDASRVPEGQAGPPELTSCARGIQTVRAFESSKQQFRNSKYNYER